MSSMTRFNVSPSGRAVTALRLAVVLGVSSGLGACAQMGSVTAPGQGLAAKPATAAEPEVAKNELERATEHWGKEFDRNPRNAKAAVSYAQNLKAMGKRREALEILQTAVIFNGTDRALASEYGRLALEFGQVGVAARMLEIADDPRKPDWRIMSARGTLLAKQGRYKDAIPFFERAQAMEPERASLLNNLALAHTMSGDAAKGEELLRRAASLGGAPKVKQNLAIVLGVQGRYDEAKSAASGSGEEAANANADYLRKFVRAPARSASPATVAPAGWAPMVVPAVARGAPVAGPAVAPRQSVRPVAPTVAPAVVPAQASSAAPAPVRTGVFDLKPAQR
jgi:Flp pilus assembly protein TadD